MDEMKEPHAKRAIEEELIAIYEKLRAAEKNRSADYPFSDWTMDVNVDWLALERRVLKPSLPMRIRSFCFAVAPRVVASSIIGPVIGIIITFFWLRTARADASQEFALRVVIGSSSMVLMFIWAALSMQAMNRVAQLKMQKLALRDARQPAAEPPPGNFLFSPSRMTLGFFVVTAFVSTTVMGMATYNANAGALQRRWLHPVMAEFSERPVPVEIEGGSFSASTDLYEQLADKTAGLTAMLPRDVPADARVGDTIQYAAFQIRRANLGEAQRALIILKTRDNLPAAERARADMLAGYIDARETWQKLLAAPHLQQRDDLVSRLDLAIGNVTNASRSLKTDARVLLSYLYLARAAVTEDPADRQKWSEAAINFSLHALDATGVR